jgi:hypothetical protein
LTDDHVCINLALNETPKLLSESILLSGHEQLAQEQNILTAVFFTDRLYGSAIITENQILIRGNSTSPFKDKKKIVGQPEFAPGPKTKAAGACTFALLIGIQRKKGRTTDHLASSMSLSMRRPFWETKT